MTSGASDPKAGDFRELHAIAAAVIGGCALMGGYGSVIGAVLGAFIFAIASRGINFVPFIDNNLFGYARHDGSWCCSSKSVFEKQGFERVHDANHTIKRSIKIFGNIIALKVFLLKPIRVR